VAAVRFGLIGYGAWGSHHARAIAQTDGAGLLAIAARSAESRTAAQAAHPHATTYADYRELLARDDLDVVDVVLPSDLHLEVGQAVLASGKHLLMEKPMALTVAACRQLDALARSQGKRLAIGFEMRLSELWGKAQQMVAAGAVGVPRYALIALWRRPYRQGSQNWRYDVRHVGSWILEEPIHFFDLSRWYFAPLGEPVSVYARASSQRAGRPELQDNFTAVLNFPQDAHVVITQTLSAFEHHQVVQLTGTKGALWASWHGALDRDLHPVASLRYFDGNQVHEIPLGKPTGEVYELQEEIAMMVRAVRDGGPLAATALDGTWAVGLCEAAQESIAGGGAIPVKAP
jgi:myo-inositol 2-dehydrogenase/D-chiro-inositol 1-dehydrogenase